MKRVCAATASTSTASDAASTTKRHPWLRAHEHTNGPWCWVLDMVSPIGPWPWRGAQGLWDIDQDELGRVANQVLGVGEPAHSNVSGDA